MVRSTPPSAVPRDGRGPRRLAASWRSPTGGRRAWESRSRVAIARAGLPVPELQRPVLHAGGTASADFGWPQHRTVGEFDGKAKYQRMLRPGQTPADAVYEEKLREDAIRAQGWEVVRWHWADLRDFAPTAASIRDRFRA